MKPKRMLCNLAFLVCAVGANCLGALFAQHITFPLYLDSLLTIAVVAVSGVWWGCACAVLTNGTFMFLNNPLMLIFSTCHVITAVLAHLTFAHYQKLHEHKSIPLETFLWAGLWSALSNGLLGDIISSLLYSSSTSPHVNNVVQGIYVVTHNLVFATYFAGMLTNLVDKMISASISFGVYKMYQKKYSHFY